MYSLIVSARLNDVDFRTQSGLPMCSDASPHNPTSASRLAVGREVLRLRQHRQTSYRSFTSLGGCDLAGSVRRYVSEIQRRADDELKTSWPR